MLRRLAVSGCFVAVLSGIAGTAAAAPADAVIVFWIDDIALSEWTTPALRDVLDRGAVAMLSTRTASASRSPVRVAAAERATFLAGSLSKIDRAGAPSSQGMPAALKDSLERARVPFYDTEPGASFTLPSSGVSIVDPVGRSPREIDRLLSGVLLRSPNATIIVAGLTAEARVRRGFRVGTVAMVGPGVERGLLASPTTRTAGVVALIDLAPSVLDLLGVEPVAPMQGRAVDVIAHPDPIAVVGRLETKSIEAAEARRPLTRGMLWAGAAMAALAVVAVLTRRGRSRRERVPRGGRDWLRLGLSAASAVPLAIYLEGLTATTTVGSAVAFVALCAIALAVSCRLALGPALALPVIAGITVLVVCVDVAFGSPIGHASPLAFNLAIGARYYGAGDDVLGVAVGAALVAAGALLDAAPSRRWAAWVAAAFGGIVLVLGAPALGSTFGAAPTAVPAFGVFALRAGGRRMGLRAVSAVAVCTIAVTGLLVAADALRSPDTQTHVARAASDGDGIGDVVARKLERNAKIALTTAWLPGAALLAGSVLIVIWRRRDAFDRAMFGRPHLRAALVACVVAAVCAIAFNDGGVIPAAIIALYATAAAMSAVVAPDP